MRKLLSIILTAFMVISFTPLATYAAGDTDDTRYEGYTLYVGNEKVTADYSSGENWSFDPDTKTLAITGLNISLNNPTKYGIRILGSDSINTFNILIKGRNEISTSVSTGNLVQCRNCNLNLRGSGTLYLTDNSKSGIKKRKVEGISVSGGDLIIGESAVLETASSIKKSGNYNITGIQVTGGDIVIKNSAKLTSSTSNSLAYNSAIYTDGNLIVMDNSSVIATSGNTSNDGSKSIAIFAKKGIQISSGTSIIAQSGNSKNISYAINSSKGAISMTGGTLTIKAGKSTGKKNKKNKKCSSIGIITDSKNIEITGGIIMSESSSALYSRSISSGGSIYITGGTINATAGAGKKASSSSPNAAIYYKKDCLIQNAKVSALSNAKVNGYGIYTAGTLPVIREVVNMKLGGNKSVINETPFYSSCAPAIYAGKTKDNIEFIPNSTVKTYKKKQYMQIDTVRNTTGYDLCLGTLTGVKDAKYTGKAIKPNVVVRYNGNKLIKGIDYTVRYTNNKAVGTARVIVSGKGEYTGGLSATFKIKAK